jgi:hypothetical protein
LNQRHDFINDEIKSPTDIEVSFEDMKKIVNYHRKNPKHKFKTIQNRFRVLKRPQQLTRFKKYVENGRTKKQKLIEICKLIWDKFKKAREKLLAVHDRDLQRWGRTKAKQLTFDFKGNNSFLKKFMSKYEISNRRVRKFVSKNSIRDQETIKTSASNFQLEVINEISNYESDLILNSGKLHFKT